ncbi:MAG TPA: hypothetical protein PLE75_10760 [Ferruginibacter sp.]|nr:hypothetical protein [Ferruginibacter sp.]HRN91626.1 hypothetical protein [Ferruginibacter sp.]HRO07154.1 hypothetical protein [Ferruginibacter sp.]HRO97577.1 hypothetical protein [Ferruginibacter sp.]HRP50615.1 hypothetical protein [Ferruginibacter sp.]
MKNKVKELDVDFIGGQSAPLTKKELLSISAFIKQMKDQRTKKLKRRLKKVEKPTT